MEKRAGIHDPPFFALFPDTATRLINREARPVSEICISGWLSVSTFGEFDNLGGTLRGQTWTPPPGGVLRQLMPEQGAEPMPGDTVRAAYHLLLCDGREFLVVEIMSWSEETLHISATQVRIRPSLA